MPLVSQQKKDKIAEHILHILFTKAPEPAFTAEIAQEVARDEEFIKAILLELEKKKLVVQIKQNTSGIIYARRRRWRLSNQAFTFYQAKQEHKASAASLQYE